ncbi:MAG: tRNA (adenosine(37)-N6)-threonylcarbamoyltransferase complex dimerization subunit type 1 TsaB [Gammaproteobacteria bacterium]|nr:tRNA (adenosine(37)-N6)-threonylcarbamoyltransferase complex dimerization subunit type 1 TsaB [Gammaproteobacteria bacterium]
MNILALETSTDACSVALSVAGEIRERFEVAPRNHSRLILPMAEELLAEAGLMLSQIDALAFGCGPGSFTGVRIAAGVAQGIAFGADLPVVPVSTLAALAQGVHEQFGTTHVLSALDARMSEVYWGAYRMSDNGMMQLQGEEGVYPPGHVPVPAAGHWQGAGSGWQSYSSVLHIRLQDRLSATYTDHHPRARAVAQLGAHGFTLGQAVSAEQAQPVYLRNEVTWKKLSDQPTL